MTDPLQVRRPPALRIAAALVFGGVIANFVIARAIYGDAARVLYGRQSWAGDFILHVMSFPGPPLAGSIFPRLIEHFRVSIIIDRHVLGHFHNMPETVLITLIFRPMFSVIDPLVVYMLTAAAVVSLWAWVCHRYADADVRPLALGLALFSYPLILMIERGNLFAGMTAICLLVVLCRRKQDWVAALLLAVAANVRPNVVILALPLLSFNRESLVFLVKTAVIGAVLGLACLALASFLYPAYTIPNILRGLALYNAGYVIGPFAEFGSSLWGAARHLMPVTGTSVTLCTLIGLLPLAPAWLGRNRLSYAAICFLTIAACTLSTAVLADYHLMIFMVPLLVMKRDDPAFWPILLGSCWMLIPKNYTPVGELSWQNYLNPAGLVVAVLFVMAAFRGQQHGQPLDGPLPAQS